MNADARIIVVGQEPPSLRTASTKSPKSRSGAKSGRFGVLNAFIDFTLRDLDRASAVVWLLLYRDTKADGLARTAQSDLATRAGVNVRTVRRACAELEVRKLLTVVHRGGLRSGLSTYRVHPLAKQPQ